MFIKVRAQKRAASYNSPLSAAASESFVRARDEALAERSAQPADGAADPDWPTGPPADRPTKPTNRLHMFPTIYLTNQPTDSMNRIYICSKSIN